MPWSLCPLWLPCHFSFSIAFYLPFLISSTWKDQTTPTFQPYLDTCVDLLGGITLGGACSCARRRSSLMHVCAAAACHLSSPTPPRTTTAHCRCWRIPARNPHSPLPHLHEPPQLAASARPHLHAAQLALAFMMLARATSARRPSLATPARASSSRLKQADACVNNHNSLSHAHARGAGPLICRSWTTCNQWCDDGSGWRPFCGTWRRWTSVQEAEDVEHKQSCKSCLLWCFICFWIEFGKYIKNSMSHLVSHPWSTERQHGKTIMSQFSVHKLNYLLKYVLLHLL